MLLGVDLLDGVQQCGEVVALVDALPVSGVQSEDALPAGRIREPVGEIVDHFLRGRPVNADLVAELRGVHHDQAHDRGDQHHPDRGDPPFSSVRERTPSIQQ